MEHQAGRGPVEVTLSGTVRKLARLAFVARQFGYDYADVRTGQGSRGQATTLRLEPDPRPEARERAERSRARYPRASAGGPLPPLVPEEVELLRTRICFDLSAGSADKPVTLLAVLLVTGTAVALGVRLGADTADWIVTGVFWALCTALVPVLRSMNRRYTVTYAQRLEAAGFTPVMDGNGRPRYVPPGGQPG